MSQHDYPPSKQWTGLAYGCTTLNLRQIAQFIFVLNNGATARAQ